MFTGLIQAVGQVSAIERQESSSRLEISSKEIAAQIAQGDSVSVNGVCLTAISFDKEKFSVDVMVQTLNLTSTGSLEVGSAVNLELATRTADRLGGHIVQGHVDGVAQGVEACAGVAVQVNDGAGRHRVRPRWSWTSRTGRSVRARCPSPSQRSSAGPERCVQQHR